jgi:hydroxyacylglutathione hydrolase
MFFRQVLHEDLGCASYVIAEDGEAAVIDPKWEIDEYLELAEEHGFRISHVLETHNHADHVSGHGRLAKATGAVIHVSEKAGVAYEHEPLADGDAVAIGQVQIVAIATPGHRPEHLAFVVEDGSRSGSPWLVVTGDSLFVGDLARPDLAVEPEDGARDLFSSVRRLLELEDFAEVWPGHIGGSLCGGAGMSEKPGSTIGFERRFNRLLSLGDEQKFVRELTDHLAPQPPNFKQIVALNSGPLVSEAQSLDPLAPGRVQEFLEGGATLVDGRAPREYDAGHVPGSINVTMARAAVGTRAAWVIDPKSEVVVTAGSDAEAVRLGRMLEAVGFRRLAGHLAGGASAWREPGLPLDSTPTLDIPGLARRLEQDDVLLLDVREQDEWKEGHVAGSLHVPYHDLVDQLPAEIRNGQPVAVACSAGNRSSIAASLLRRSGLDNVIHVVEGGVQDLPAEGVQLVRT